MKSLYRAMNLMLTSIFLLIALFSVAASSPALAEPGKNNGAPWTINDTVNSAFTYSPAIKQEQEETRAAKENVRQAEAGNRPQLNIYSGTGGQTVLVPNR